MSNKENMIQDDNRMRELTVDELEDVIGGKIKVTGYVALGAAMKQFKDLGKSKEYAIKAIKSGWAQGCTFRTALTDGTEADLKAAIDFVDKYWSLLP